MSEWWSYGLSDFLMFSPQAYWRLVARHNAAWWPAQALGVAASLALLVLAARPLAYGVRASLLLLAAGWAWVGWAFHWQRYAEIFLAAPQLAAASGAQALMLAVAATMPAGGTAPAAPHGVIRGAGLALLAASALYPLLAIATGRSWSEAEVFGFMPDPTALATLGALLTAPGLRWHARWLLALLPALFLALGGATHWLLR